MVRPATIGKYAAAATVIAAGLAVPLLNLIGKPDSEPKDSGLEDKIVQESDMPEKPQSFYGDSMEKSIIANIADVRGYEDYEVPQVTRSNLYEDVIKKSYTMPVFVKATAEWCMPCKAIADSYRHAAKQFNDVNTGYFSLMELDLDLFHKDGLDELFESRGISNVGDLVESIPRIGVFYQGKLHGILSSYGEQGESALVVYRETGNKENINGREVNIYDKEIKRFCIVQEQGAERIQEREKDDGHPLSLLQRNEIGEIQQLLMAVARYLR